MRKVFLSVSIIIGLTAIILSGCYNDHAQDLYPQSTTCDTTNVTYTATLKSIVDNQCATSGCHQGVIPSGYDLSTYNGLKNAATLGKLMPSLNYTGPSPMPKGLPKLDDCTIAKFQAWVNNNEPQ